SRSGGRPTWRTASGRSEAAMRRVSSVWPFGAVGARPGAPENAGRLAAVRFGPGRSGDIARGRTYDCPGQERGAPIVRARGRKEFRHMFQLRTIAQRVEGIEALDQPAEQTGKLLEPYLTKRPLKDVLSGTWIGHP